MNIFDGHKNELGIGKKTEKHEINLLGYNRIGFNLLKAFEKTKKKYFGKGILNARISCCYKAQANVAISSPRQPYFLPLKVTTAGASLGCVQLSK